MYATPARSAGKPKIVTIFPPTSVSTISPSHLDKLPSPDGPSTPTRICQEISVFSPDTPVRYSHRTSTYSRTSLRPLPLTPHGYCPCNLSNPVGSSPSSGCNLSMKYSPDVSFTESHDTSRTELSNYTVASPRQTPLRVISPTGEATAWS